MEVAAVGYRKTDGFATIHGQMFEVKLAALLFLRATDRALHFQLAVNVDGAGALDDVVIRYKAVGVGKSWHTGFIQLKHKECASVRLEMFTAPMGNFSLQKYLSSYMKIKSAMLAEKKEDIFNGSLDNCHLAIYTNANPGLRLQKRPFVCDETDDGGFESLLKSGRATEMIFGFDAERDADVVASLADFEDASAEDVAEFLSKLKVFCGQPSESELDELLNAEVSSMLRRTKLLAGRQMLREDVVDIVDKLVQEFHVWWSVKQNAHVLDQESNIINQILVQFLSTDTKKSHRIDVEFEVNCVHSFHSHLAEGLSLLSVITRKASFKLSCTKVMQAFHAEEHPGKTGACIFLTLERFLADESAVTSAWTLGDHGCLCLVHAASEPPPPGIHERLCDALTRYPTKKCVLLSVRADAQAAALCAAMLGDKFREITDCVLLSHLCVNSKNAFLDRIVDSQGRSTTVGRMIGASDQCSMLINDEMVDSVLSREPISVGQDLNAFTDESSFYIARTLERGDVVAPDFLASQTSGCILLTGTSAEDLSDLAPKPDAPDPDVLPNQVAGCRFITSHSKPNQEQLDALRKHDRITHWFHQKPSGKLQWIWSLQGAPSLGVEDAASASGRLLRMHLQTDEYPTESVDVAGRVVLVVAEPGMGKTMLLDHLAVQAKSDHPDRLVVRINLGDHTKLLAAVASRKTSVIDFLMSAADVSRKSLIEKSVFRRCFESSGCAVVLLDGFDELTQSFREEGCAMITSLLETKVERVWVTSRHSMKDKLEGHLSTIAFNLQPFTEADQTAYVKTFWQRSRCSGCDLSDAALEARIGDFLSSVTVSLRDEERLFMGVPLQMMMLAEVFQDQALSLNSDIILRQDNLNILNLFEKFVEKKLAVFSSKIFASSLANNEGVVEDIRKMFIKNHMYASLVLVLSDVDLSLLKARDKIVKKASRFLQKIEDGKDKTGIIHSVINGQPRFVHRTFAEYFTAQWLSKHFADARALLDARLYEANFQVVRTFFDLLLAKGCALHHAVLANNGRELEALIDAGFDLNAADRGGRTALHLAAAMGFTSCIKVLPPSLNIVKEEYKVLKGPRPEHFVERLLALKDVHINIVDNVLGLTPLQLAFKTESWDAVEILLQVDDNVGTGIRNAAEALSSVNQNMDGLRFLEKSSKLLTMMIVVSVYGFVNFVTLLLSLGVPVDLLISNDFEHYTMITVAAAFGEFELVELLIKKGANFTKRIVGASNFPLHFACVRGHTAVVKLLVSAVPDSVQRLEFINSLDNAGRAALHYVIEYGRTDILRFLLSLDADITNRRQTSRGTALHKACGFYGQLPIVKILIERFGDDIDGKLKYINTVNGNRQSAVSIAARHGHTGIVDFLIDQGCEVAAGPALHMACEGGNLSVVHSLVKSVGNDTKASFINRVNEMSKSPLFIAAEYGFSPIVEFLVSEGSDLYHANSEYDTALILASKEGRTAVVNVLVKLLGQDEFARKAFINRRNLQGKSSVSIAAYHKHLLIADFLIRKGGDSRAKNIGISQSALHEACLKGDFPAVKAIVEGVEDDKAVMLEIINGIATRRSLSSLAIAIQRGFPSIAEYLVRKGCDIQPTQYVSYLHFACRRGQLSVAKAMMERFGNDEEARRSFVHHLDMNGESVLDAALAHEEMVSFLCNEGAPLRCADLRSVRSPLHEACKRGQLRAVETLLACFGDDTEALLEYINHTGANGHTALYDAACRGHADVVGYLLKKGAKVTKYNPGSKTTALHEACKAGHLGVVEVIVNSFGDDSEAKMSFINAPNYFGDCALNAAASRGRASVVAFLSKQYWCLFDAPVNASTRQTALHDACLPGGEKVVRALLDSFAEDHHAQKSIYVNRLNSRGFSAVYIAAYKADRDIADLLVRSGGDAATQKQAVRDKSFHDACTFGNFATVRETLDSFGDDNDGKLNFLNPYNIYNDTEMPTPLRLAICGGNADIVALLISQGCDLRSRRSGKLFNYLHEACEKGHLSVVRAIIGSFGDDMQSKSGHINSCDALGRSALFIAAYEADRDLTEYLVAHGGDASVCDKARTQAALHDAARLGSSSRVKGVLDSMAHDPRMKMEVMNGVDSKSDSALTLAACRGHVGVVRLLVEEGVDLHRRVTPTDDSVLQGVILRSPLEVSSALLEGFGDAHAKAKLINSLNREGQSVLYYACERASVEIVSLLRSHGGDVNAI